MINDKRITLKNAISVFCKVSKLYRNFPIISISHLVSQYLCKLKNFNFQKRNTNLKTSAHSLNLQLKTRQNICIYAIIKYHSSTQRKFLDTDTETAASNLHVT